MHPFRLTPLEGSYKDRDWRFAVRFLYAMDDDGRRSVHLGFLDDAFGDEVDLKPLIALWEWRDPWVAVIRGGDPTGLLTDDRVLATLGELNGYFRIQEVVAFNRDDEYAPKADRGFFVDELCDPLRELDADTRLAVAQLVYELAEGEGRIGFASNGDLRGVLAYIARFATQPGWEHLATGAVEILGSEGPVGSFSYTNGRVSGRPDGLDQAAGEVIWRTGEGSAGQMSFAEMLRKTA